MKKTLLILVVIAFCLPSVMAKEKKKTKRDMSKMAQKLLKSYSVYEERKILNEIEKRGKEAHLIIPELIEYLTEKTKESFHHQGGKAGAFGVGGRRWKYPAKPRVLKKKKKEEKEKKGANEDPRKIVIEILAALGKKSLKPMIKALEGKKYYRHGGARRVLIKMASQFRKELISALKREIERTPPYNPTVPIKAIRGIPSGYGYPSPMGKPASLVNVLRLSQCLSPSEIEILCRALSRKGYYLRLESARALGEMGKKARGALSALLRAIKIEGTRAKYYEILALGEIGIVRKDVLKVLFDCLGKRQYGSTASEALARLGKESEEVRERLKKALKTKEKGERTFVLCTLGKIDQTISFALPEICKVLKTFHKPTYTQASSHIGALYQLIKLLGEMGPEAKKAVPYLIPFVQKEKIKVRQGKKTYVMGGYQLQEYAIKALGNIGPGARQAVPSLIKLLKKGESGHSEVAAEALGKIGGQKARKALEFVIASDIYPEAFRVYCVKSLGKMGAGAQKSLPVLLPTLDENKVLFRVWTVVTIARIGKPRKKVLKILEKVSQTDLDEEVRRAARWGMKNLEKEKE